MKRKIMNIVELALHFITLLIMFTSKCTSMIATGEYYMGKPVYRDAIVPWYTEISANPIYFIPLVVLWLISTVMCAVSIFSKTYNSDGKMHSAMPIINFVVTVWCMISLPLTEAFFTVVILMFVIIILGFVKRSKIIVGETTPTTVNIASTNADELKKYKNLLDSGAITQEEYDIKKKELLNS